MDQRPDDPAEEPTPSGPAEPAADAPRSTIISSEPVLSSDAASTPATGPEVAWGPAAPDEVEVPGAPGLVFAGVVNRFVAYFIDGIILTIPLVIITSVTAPPVPTTPTNAPPTFDDLAVVDPLSTIAYLALTFAYFVGFWMSEGRATLGMRVMKLQVGNAFDGRRLTLSQGVARWAFLGYPLGLLALIASLTAISTLASFGWAFVLLVSTAASPTKQGIHDRIANSAVVQPAGRGTSGVAIACLVIVLIFLAIVVIGFVGLLALGTQVSTLYEQSGQP